MILDLGPRTGVNVFLWALIQSGALCYGRELTHREKGRAAADSEAGALRRQEAEGGGHSVCKGPEVRKAVSGVRV